MAHRTISIHLVVHLAAFVMILRQTVVFVSEFVPLHVRIVQAVIIRISVLFRESATVSAVIARARPRIFRTVDESAIAIHSELDFSLVPGLTHSGFCTNRRKSHLILHLVKDEQWDCPLTAVFIPCRTLTELVLVIVVEHDLNDSLIELNVLFLHANDIE